MRRCFRQQPRDARHMEEEEAEHKKTALGEFAQANPRDKEDARSRRRSQAAGGTPERRARPGGDNEEAFVPSEEAPSLSRRALPRATLPLVKKPLRHLPWARAMVVPYAGLSPPARRAAGRSLAAPAGEGRFARRSDGGIYASHARNGTRIRPRKRRGSGKRCLHAALSRPRLYTRNHVRPYRCGTGPSRRVQPVYSAVSDSDTVYQFRGLVELMIHGDGGTRTERGEHKQNYVGVAVFRPRRSRCAHCSKVDRKGTQQHVSANAVHSLCCRRFDIGEHRWCCQRSVQCM